MTVIILKEIVCSIWHLCITL